MTLKHIVVVNSRSTEIGSCEICPFKKIQKRVFKKALVVVVSNIDDFLVWQIIRGAAANHVLQEKRT